MALNLTQEEEERVRRLDAMGASVPQWLAMQGEGVSALGDIIGAESPALESWTEKQQRKLSGFKSQHPGRLLADPEPFEWWKEKAALNSMNTIAPLLGFAIGNTMKAIPHPIAKVLGSVINWGTMAMTYNMNFADTLEEHKTAAGRELTPSEKSWAAAVSMGVTYLDLIVPIRGANATSAMITKTFGNGGVKATRDALVKLVNTNRDKLLTQVGKGAKFSGKMIGTEMATEATQKALQMGTSQQPGRLGTSQGLQEVMEEAVVAGPVVGGITAPAAVGVARSQNRDLSTARRLAQGFNRQMLENEEEGSTRKVANQIEIPEGPGFTPASKILAGKVNKAIKQSPLNVDLGKLGKMVAENAAFKPLNSLVDIRKRARNGKEFHAANNAYQMFSPLDAYSNQKGTGKRDFFSLKETKTGEYLTPVMQVLNKYATKKTVLGMVGIGEFGKRFDQNVSDYILDSIEGKVSRETIANLPKEINRKQLDRDINKVIKPMIKQAHTDLKSSVKHIGEIENYLHRPVSAESVRQDKKGFIKSLEESAKRAYNERIARLIKEGVSKEEAIERADPIMKRVYDRAPEIAEEVINGVDSDLRTIKQIQRDEQEVGLGKPSFERSRSEAWKYLDKKYRDRNVERVLTGYLQKAATRVASTRAFGENASFLRREMKKLADQGVINQKEINKIYDVYDAAHNIYKRDTSPNVLAASKVGTTVGAITHLGLATISSITELAWVGERAGFGHMLLTLPSALKYVTTGFRRAVAKEYKKPGHSAATMAVLGYNLDPRVNERLDAIFSTDHSTVLSAYFRSPFGGFLTQWTNFNRNWAAQAMFSNINHRANSIISGDISDIERSRLSSELKENGISYSDFKRITDLYKNKNGKVRVDITNDKILNTILRTEKALVRDAQKGKKKKDGTRGKGKDAVFRDRDVTVRDILVPWIHKVVDDVVVHPRAANKPLWMSDPKFAMIAQLKTFPIVFGNTVVKRLLRKLNPKQCTPDYGAAIGAVGGIAMAYALVHLGQMMKSAIRQVDYNDPGIRETFDRAGLTGAVGMVAGSGRFHQGVWTSLLGTGAGFVDRAFVDMITPIYTSEEPFSVGDNLIDWFGESVDGALGPAGIYFKPLNSVVDYED